jgi:RsfA family transcription factor
MNTQKTKWSNEDEDTLLELVENYLKKGKSKQDAFVTVANIINRSKAACASRYQLLKKQKMNHTASSKPLKKTNLDLEKVILFLTKYESDQQLSDQNIQLKHSINMLQKKNEELSVKISQLKTSIKNNQNFLKNIIN